MRTRIVSLRRQCLAEQRHQSLDSRNCSPTAFWRLAATLAFATCAYGVPLEVTTTVTSPSSPNPVNICVETATLTLTFKNNSGGPAPAGSLVQTLPAGCSLVIGTLCPGLNVNQNQNLITYSLPPLNNQDSCSVTANLIIPCSVTTAANAALSVLYGSTDYTFAPDPTATFQVSRPIMHIVDFFDDASPPVGISANVPHKLLVSQNHQRQFDFLVSDGVINGFTFTYGFESEINPKGFVLEGVLANGASTGQTLPLAAATANPETYVINAAAIASLFPGQSTMVFGQRIRVKERFDVVRCSPSPNNDATDYAVTWDCPSSPDPSCRTDSTRRSLLVEASGGGLRPGYSMPNLDLCGATPADILLWFSNSSYDSATGKLPGSAMKTLRRVEIPMNLDPFTAQGVPLNTTPNNTIFLEGSGTVLSVDVTTLNPGFYSYDAVNRVVTLNFDALTGQPLGPTGPLVSAFIPEQPQARFNEFVDSGVLYLRFKGVIFHCKDAIFNAASPYLPPFDFDDWPKPSGGYLFFGNSVNDRWTFYYENMCQGSNLGSPLTPAARSP